MLPSCLEITLFSPLHDDKSDIKSSKGNKLSDRFLANPRSSLRLNKQNA